MNELVTGLREICYNKCMEKKICSFRECKKKFLPAYSSQKFCSVSCSNRKNKNNRVSVYLPKTKTVQLAELFGILLGDGGVEHYFMRIYLNRVADNGYEKNVKKILEDLFRGVSVSMWDRPLRGTVELQISAVEVCDYLRSIGFDAKSREVPKWILSNPDFTKATVRGLFDTEGHLSFKEYRGKTKTSLYGQLTVTNKNKNILLFLEKSLRDFGYKPTKGSGKNIYISNRGDIMRYFDEIGSSNPKLLARLASLQKLG